jgi:hypothetical protein
MMRSNRSETERIMRWNEVMKGERYILMASFSLQIESG